MRIISVVSRPRKNLTLHPEVIRLGEEIAEKRDMSLSGLIEILIRDEAAKDANATLVKEVSELRADVTRLKQATAEYSLKVKQHKKAPKI